MKIEINEYKIKVADPFELREMLEETDLDSPFYNLILGRLTQLASTDQLTGVYNRHMWVGEFLRELKHTDNSSKYLGCILVDLDNFGEANKKYGHGFCDLVLSRFGVCIKRRLRTLSTEIERERRSGERSRGDIFGRYGGEEFIIFSPQNYNEGKDAVHGMKRLGEKVQLIGEAVTTSAVLASAHTAPEDYITLSLGCALYRGEHGKSLEYYDGTYDRTKVGEHSLIRKADEALSLAKSTGKNKSVCLEKIV